MDRVYPANNEETIQIYHSASHEWCYLSGQSESEALIFVGGDSSKGMAAGKKLVQVYVLSALLKHETFSGVPHCSFQLPGSDKIVTPRESVEVRALVFHTPEMLDLERVLESRMHGPKSNFQY